MKRPTRVRTAPKTIHPRRRTASVSMAVAPGWKMQIRSSSRSAMSQPIVGRPRAEQPQEQLKRGATGRFAAPYRDCNGGFDSIFGRRQLLCWRRRHRRRLFRWLTLHLASSAAVNRREAPPLTARNNCVSDRFGQNEPISFRRLCTSPSRTWASSETEQTKSAAIFAPPPFEKCGLNFCRQSSLILIRNIGLREIIRIFAGRIK